MGYYKYTFRAKLINGETYTEEKRWDVEPSLDELIEEKSKFFMRFVPKIIYENNGYVEYE